VIVTCPGCGLPLNAPAEAVGRAVRCTGCQREFVLPAQTGPAGPGGVGPALGGPAVPVYGDEVYQLSFDLRTVPALLLNYWGGWRPRPFSSVGAVLIDLVTCGGLFGTIFYGLKFDDLPKASREDFGAGKGIGFMFIPYFNFYWQFRFWWGLVDRINLQLRLRGWAALLVSRGLATATCVLALCCPPAHFICREILIYRLQEAINAMAAAPPPVFVAAVPPATT